MSPESQLHQPGKLTMPNLPGLHDGSQGPNPFSGIRRAGQAKRAMNFEKWQNAKSGAGSDVPDQKSFDGSKFQMAGGQAKTQFGSMRQAKF